MSNIVSKKKYVVMLSGGPDSAALAAELASNGNDVHALFYDYGQSAVGAELSSARATARKLGLEFDLVDISKIKNTFLGLSGINIVGLGFLDKIGNCPHGLFGITASFACLVGANGFAVGLHSQDFPEAPMVGEYIAKYQEAVAILQPGFEVSTPFIKLKKSEVMSIGAKHGVSFEHTWSCLENGHTHCGVCKACLDRKEAFSLAGLVDPTSYSVG